jgi:hypothetical protein
VLLARVAARGEGALAAPDRDADGAGVHELLQSGGERLAQRESAEHLGGQRVLGLRPLPGARIGRVLEPPVRVGDVVSVQVLDEVEPGGLGVAHRPHGSSPGRP